jgi:hypothetical protein
VPIFWLDANVFIEANDRYYPLARVPQFWSFLGEKIGEGSICCPKSVYDELVIYGDELARWVKTRKKEGYVYNLTQAFKMNSVEWRTTSTLRTRVIGPWNFFPERTRGSLPALCTVGELL